MIIDFTQKKEGIEISYVDDDRTIKNITAPLKYGYYKYVTAEEFEKNGPSTVTGLRSFKTNSLIKKEPAKRFTNHNINEYFNQELKIEYPDIHDKISRLVMPMPYSVDIETEITDETGYSTPEKAENRILTISVTDIQLNTLIFAVKNPEQPEFTDKDKLIIKNFMRESLGEKYQDAHDFEFEIRVFDTEVEMLNVFLECMNKFFHSIFGWNFTTFDWVYIYNRCVNLGINVAKASPTGGVVNKKFKAQKKGKEETEIDVKMPTHRVINDYMTFFKQSLIYNNLGSYSLNSIAELILELKKVMYSGNLRTLYNNSYNKFIAYAIMDTVLVMMIHRKTNLYDVDFFESYFNGIAYLKISQNAISEALVYNELRPKNIFLPESEFNVSAKIKYEGGYVKTPLQKIIEACAGVDFSGLYPNSINTIGISPEKRIDKIQVDEFGRPLTERDWKKWEEYKKQDCILSPRGNIYERGETDGLFPTIEKKLIAQRKVFKGHAENIYLNHLTRIDKRMKQLNPNHK